MRRGEGNDLHPIFSMDLNQKDALGRDLGKNFLLLTDLNFEKRLKLFDPNLRLAFHKKKQRWMILEKRFDGLWNLLMTLEDDQGNAKAPGDWAINQLAVWRQNYEVRRGMGEDRWWQELEKYCDVVQEEREAVLSVENQLRVIDSINLWRKGFRGLQNLPQSDVVAGYPKVNVKPKPK
jgi:hypothetical protein